MPIHTEKVYDAAVVGGGPIGLSVAWRAAQRGLRIVLLERSTVGSGASDVAAGMLAPTAEAEFGAEALLRLGLASAAAYPALAHELTELTGLDSGYLRCGTLVIARDRDEAEALERERAHLERVGLTVEKLRPSDARRREPALAPTLRSALDVPDDHAVDPRLLVPALAAAAREAGVEVREGAEVVALTGSGEEVTGVELTGGECVAAGAVVVAAGCWSARLRGVPDAARVPVRPVKGQILRLRDPAGPGLVSRVLQMADGYLVPRGDGRYVLGATMEERGWDTTVTAGGVLDLLRDASEVVPGLSELVLEEASAGLRPGTPDNAPILGPGGMSGLHWATGHHRNGILLAPITGEIVAAGLAGEALPALAGPFSPGRFAPGLVGAR